MENRNEKGQFIKGIHSAPETEFKNGFIPWNKNTKGLQIAWNKGKRLGHFENSGQFKNGQTPHNKGVKVSESEIERIRKMNKGRISSEEVKKKISAALSGEKSPNWKGGISFEPYCPKFNKQLKEQIRDRDNRTCQLCGEKENGKKLACHHIHYDKPNCKPDLVSLCISCNCKVNFNRDYYEILFMQSLTQRGLA